MQLFHPAPNPYTIVSAYVTGLRATAIAIVRMRELAPYTWVEMIWLKVLPVTTFDCHGIRHIGRFDRGLRVCLV
jgi:hypothetical protein